MDGGKAHRFLHPRFFLPDAQKPGLKPGRAVFLCYSVARYCCCVAAWLTSLVSRDLRRAALLG